MTSLHNQTFPQKLYMIIESEPDEAIMWLPHGLAFQIMNYDMFANHTIPKYFRREYTTKKIIKILLRFLNFY